MGAQAMGSPCPPAHPHTLCSPMAQPRRPQPCTQRQEPAAGHHGDPEEDLEPSQGNFSIPLAMHSPCSLLAAVLCCPAPHRAAELFAGPFSPRAATKAQISADPRAVPGAGSTEPATGISQPWDSAQGCPCGGAEPPGALKGFPLLQTILNLPHPRDLPIEADPTATGKNLRDGFCFSNKSFCCCLLLLGFLVRGSAQRHGAGWWAWLQVAGCPDLGRGAAGASRTGGSKGSEEGEC